MKITGFCPIIVTKDQEAIVQVFEALGFERCHLKTDIEGGQNENIAMKDANGNVDDFDEAYEFLLSKGFVNSRGDKITETSSARSTMLFSPSGFGITLTQHLK